MPKARPRPAAAVAMKITTLVKPALSKRLALGTSLASELTPSKERDPSGLDAHAPGAKLDAGKVRCGLVNTGFARALLEVGRVGTLGAAKYTDNGWMQVPNGESRYNDALHRHLLKSAVEPHDPDSGQLHYAHAAWNALAILELMLRKEEVAAKASTQGPL